MPLSMRDYNAQRADPERSAKASKAAFKRALRERHLEYLFKAGKRPLTWYGQVQALFDANLIDYDDTFRGRKITIRTWNPTLASLQEAAARERR